MAEGHQPPIELIFLAICFGSVLCQDDVIIEGLPSDRPLNVAHRGSSGEC